MELVVGQTVLGKPIEMRRRHRSAEGRAHTETNIVEQNE
jgi:hypothetical protein